MTSFNAAGLLMPLDEYYDHFVEPKPRIPRRYPGVNGNQNRRQAAHLKSYKDNNLESDGDDSDDDNIPNKLDASIELSNRRQLEYESREFDQIYDDSVSTKSNMNVDAPNNDSSLDQTPSLDQSPESSTSSGPGNVSQVPENVIKKRKNQRLNKGNRISVHNRLGYKRNFHGNRMRNSHSNYPNRNRNNNNVNRGDNKFNEQHQQVSPNFSNQLPLDQPQIFNNNNNNNTPQFSMPNLTPSCNNQQSLPPISYNNMNPNNSFVNQMNPNNSFANQMNPNNNYQNPRQMVNMPQSQNQFPLNNNNNIIGANNYNNDLQMYNNNNSNLITDSLTSLINILNQLKNNNVIERLGRRPQTQSNQLDNSANNFWQQQHQQPPESLTLADLLHFDKDSYNNSINVAEVSKNSLHLLRTVCQDNDVNQQMAQLQAQLQNSGPPMNQQNGGNCQGGLNMHTGRRFV